MDTKPPWQVIGEEFVRQYYQVFDNNREQLFALYAVRVLILALGNYFCRVIIYQIQATFTHSILEIRLQQYIMLDVSKYRTLV